MTRLPLSAKVALWSFLVAGLTMGTALMVTTIAVERDLMAPIKDRMGKQATEIFANLKHYADKPAESRPGITDEMLPRSVKNVPVEVLGSDGGLLYRSPNLKNKLTLMGGPTTPHVTFLYRQPYHVETFNRGTLTVLVGYPLSSTSMTLKRVKTAGLYALPFAGVLSLLGGYWIASRAMSASKWVSESSDMTASPSGPWFVPAANVMTPMSGVMSTSGIHIVMQRVPSIGQ